MNLTISGYGLKEGKKEVVLPHVELAGPGCHTESFRRLGLCCRCGCGNMACGNLSVAATELIAK